MGHFSLKVGLLFTTWGVSRQGASCMEFSGHCFCLHWPKMAAARVTIDNHWIKPKSEKIIVKLSTLLG